MKDYELVYSDGTSTDFKALNLKDARKKVSGFRDMSKGNAYIYSGYTCVAKLN